MVSGTVFNGQTVNDPKGDFALAGFLLQEKLQYLLGFRCNKGANAVSACDANDDGIQLAVVCEILCGLHPFNSGELLFQDFFQMILCCFNCFLLVHIMCLRSLDIARFCACCLFWKGK